MKFDIHPSQRVIIINSNSPVELNKLKTAMTVEMKDAWMIKKLYPQKNTDRCFIDGGNIMPMGLWKVAFEECKRLNIAVEMSPALIDYFESFRLGFDLFKKYVDNLFLGAVNDKGKPFKPYGYQIDAAYNILKWKKCCGEISTSGGKTLISFIMFKYLIDVVKVKRILYIVPNVDLATQSAMQYENYESYLSEQNDNWSTGVLKGGLKKREKEQVEKCTILFATFQSLARKPDEFFENFDVCINDECHHSSAKSIRKVLLACKNLQYSIGLTGTFPKRFTEDFMDIQSLIGPVVYKFTADDLINKEKRGTPIYVVFQKMDWGSKEEKSALWTLRNNKNPEDPQAGTKILKLEQKIVNGSYTRLKYIGDKAIEMKKNTLILFGDVKGGYGKRIYEYIKDNSEKNTYYVDGETKSEVRKYYEDEMENDLEGNTVMVASMGTMGEGIDLKNLWAIFLVNTSKSNRMIRQICGRGLRLFEGKTKVVLFDFVDDLRYTETGKYIDNYMWKHYKERKKIYTEQNFPIYEQDISFHSEGQLSNSKLL